MPNVSVPEVHTLTYIQQEADRIISPSLAPVADADDEEDYRPEGAAPAVSTFRHLCNVERCQDETLTASP